MLACIGAVPALRWHARQPAGSLLAHNRALCAEIIERADAADLALASPRARERRGGSVMLRLPKGADPARLVARLRSAAIHADCRGPILRFSPGVVTGAGDVERLFAELARGL